MSDLDPKTVSTLDRAAAEAAVREREPYCSTCGGPIGVVYVAAGFWPATGQPKGSWIAVCSGRVNERRRRFDFEHRYFGLGYADPDRAAGEPVYAGSIRLFG